ncbi:DUF134 domain-containing protein [uncultured Ruthenibacterium sp.]|uniref:DUF134 domain-containing protein n=1 Tax=uncultured Ruthenibacterium sp. TaxID=1905347 RepID=UPI00349ECE45
MQEFGPLRPCKRQETVMLSVDEYEVIRLIDWLDMTQEECATQMEVARTTVQAIYTSARKKIADALVNGHLLKIDGGNYRICAHQENCCLRRQMKTCTQGHCVNNECLKQNKLECGRSKL